MRPRTEDSCLGRCERSMMRSAVHEARLIVVLVGAVAAASCGGKKPPVARPIAAAARRRRPTAAPSAARAAGAGAGADLVPPEPVRDDAICSSASLDDLEPQLAAEAGLLRVRQRRLNADAQAALDRERRRAEEIRDLGGDDRRPLRRARHGRVQSGIGRAARRRGARLIWCRSAFRPTGCGRSATARNSRSIRVTTRRRSRRTAARTSSSPRSEA